MFKRKKKITTEKAILIEKNIIKTHDKNGEIKSLYRMKYGAYNTIDSEANKGKAYQLIFMTSKGSKEFFVDPQIYHGIKIDSLGMLTRCRDLFQTFKFEKIANKKDVAELEW